MTSKKLWTFSCPGSAGSQGSSRLTAGFSLVWQLLRWAVPMGCLSSALPWDPQYGTILAEAGTPQVANSSPGEELGLGEATVPLSGFRWEPLRVKQGLWDKKHRKVSPKWKNRENKCPSWSSYCSQESPQCACCCPLLLPAPPFSRKTETISLRLKRDTGRVNTTPQKK